MSVTARLQASLGSLVACNAWIGSEVRKDGGVLDSCGQATKGVWGMSWRREALKGVENCDKPGEVVKRAMIPGFPNCHMLNS